MQRKAGEAFCNLELSAKRKREERKIFLLITLLQYFQLSAVKQNKIDLIFHGLFTPLVNTLRDLQEIN